MGRLAVIGGTGVRGSDFGDAAEQISVDGVTLLDTGEFLMLQRHGFEQHVRAHEIDHRVNLLALRQAGCDRVLGLASTGSLRADLPVGSFVSPDDFYAPQVNDTLHDDARSHTVPGFDRSWRARVLDVWTTYAARPLIDGGVYAHTQGPRFETAAEVRALSRIGDLVGMTLAAECILAKEAGLAYAAICVVDNLANGLEDDPLTLDEFRRGVAENQSALLSDLARVLPVLAKPG